MAAPNDHQPSHRDVHGGHGGHVHGDNHRLPDPGADRDRDSTHGRDVRRQRGRDRHSRGHPAAATAAGSPYTLTITAANSVAPNANQTFTLTVS